MTCKPEITAAGSVLASELAKNSRYLSNENHKFGWLQGLRK
jgi:hypothetical protein